jgi:hypothetical protein
MKMLRLLAIGLIMTFITACFFSPHPAFSGQAIPVPSEWKGKATGRVFGRAFEVPIFIEIKKSLPGENNPFHIAIGDEKDANMIGSFLIMSALQFTAPYSGGKATLQYLTVHVKGIAGKSRPDQRAPSRSSSGQCIYCSQCQCSIFIRIDARCFARCLRSNRAVRFQTGCDPNHKFW